MSQTKQNENEEREGHTIGYARVSSVGQKLDVQREILEKEGCHIIFEEKVSGATRERPELTLMIKTLRKGDTVVVTKLDRVARSIIDFWDIYDEIEKKGCKFKLLDMGMDTATKAGKLTVGVMASVAEFERAMIRERQADGIAFAKAQGKHLGRPKMTDELKEQVKAMLDSGATKVAISKKLDIGVSTVYKLQKEFRE